MNEHEFDYETYADLEETYDPRFQDRHYRRTQKPRAKTKSKSSQEEHNAQLQEIAEVAGLEAGFETAYKPSKHEAGWLLQSLHSFVEQGLIEDVEALVKGGKEASVYRCRAASGCGVDHVAAKVYRPRMFRSLSNDARYREGRLSLDGDGKAANPRDRRLRKALIKKSGFGSQVAHTSWLMHEFTTLELLYAAGADVPEPLAANHNTILMAYFGDTNLPAPTLNEVRLERPAALRLYQRVIANLELMLSYGRVHGDLSAYNILYWGGEITLIDLPQVVNSHITPSHKLGERANPQAFSIFARDVQRVCDYFAQQKVQVNANRLAHTLWEKHVPYEIPDEVLLAEEILDTD